MATGASLNEHSMIDATAHDGSVTLWSGGTVQVRRIRPEDEPAMIRFHHPLLFSRPGVLIFSSLPCPLLWKIVIGIHSPTTTRS